METIHTKKGTRRHDDLNLCNLSLTYSARRDSRDLVGVPGYGAFSKEEEGAVSTDDNLPLERLDGPKFIFVALRVGCIVWYHIVDSQDAPETCLPTRSTGIGDGTQCAQRTPTQH